jgi:putative glutamine amidotransferase
VQEVAKIIDGWLIPGGNDIDASHFGEENHPEAKLMEPERFEAEAALFRTVEPDMPVFGICYGCQFLNVIRGGSLIQHLPDVVGNESHSGGTVQRYTVAEDSKLAELSTTQIEGKSYHHQAVKSVGDALKVVAKGEDGTVEAIEATDRPWMIGLQWHPERSLEDEKTRRIFAGFIEAARDYRTRRG